MTVDKTNDLELGALYKEYDTLRAEVLVRIRARFEILGLFVAGAAVLASLGEAWLLLPFGVGLIGLWLYLGFAVSRCSVRLAEIEGRVNSLVTGGSEPSTVPPPMQWETRLRDSWFNRSGLRR